MIDEYVCLSVYLFVCLSVHLLVPDFVLAYKKPKEGVKDSSEDRREVYFTNLKQQGLQFEEQDPKVWIHHKTCHSYISVL